MQRPTALATRTPKLKGTYVPVLDGFRGFAVLWIMLGHVRWRLGAPPPTSIEPVNYVVTASYFGVDLLFIVSGFVLFLPAVVNADWGASRHTRSAVPHESFPPSGWRCSCELYGRPEGGRAARTRPRRYLAFTSAVPVVVRTSARGSGLRVNSPIWTIGRGCLLRIPALRRQVVREASFPRPRHRRRLDRDLAPAHHAPRRGARLDGCFVVERRRGASAVPDGPRISVLHDPIRRRH